MYCMVLEQYGYCLEYHSIFRSHLMNGAVMRMALTVKIQAQRVDRTGLMRPGEMEPNRGKPLVRLPKAVKMMK